MCMGVETIGDNVRRRMEMKGLTISKMSDQIGMGTATISNEDLIREMSRYWGTLYVPDVVLAEVRSLAPERAVESGMTIIDTPVFKHTRMFETLIPG